MNRPTKWFFALVLPLSTACSDGNPSQRTAPAVAQDAGARIFEGNCAPCHQQDAHGLAGVYPSLVGSRVVLGNPGDFARWVVRGRRPPAMPLGRYPTVMPQFGWMKPADVAALLSYLRSNFGNAAPPVDATAVDTAAVSGGGESAS